ncbi:MAG: prolyl aminopeptidase [Rubrivivax sp.]|nr:MAG: prolyl aminopeptidase [Rubrivivax sp.]
MIRMHLYPAQEPFSHEWLDVGDGHAVYIEQCGRPDGLPVIFLHGGPGSGCSPRHRCLFDPGRYRIVLMDQRGSGRSRPRGRTLANTTSHLVQDLEAVRLHLGIGRWLVFGGSWGASLALAYAARHPDACQALLLRGAFLTGREELIWFFAEAGKLLPQAHAQLRALPGFADHQEGADLVDWYLQAVASADLQHAWVAVQHWMRWEAALTQPWASDFRQPFEARADMDDDARMQIDKYRLQAHYLQNECFLGDAALIACAGQLGDLPGLIVHGTQDLVCRPHSAWRLSRAWPGSRLQWVDQAGHSPFEPSMARALIDATDAFAAHGHFNGSTPR